MISSTLRKQFLEFFKKKGHTIVPSSSVVPHNDPTLLFVNAGMNQFKDVFLGKSHRDYVRAASAQKCIRVGGKHNDLENVGHTSRHLTFFEMLGNFSFGDYFKEQAIDYAWEAALSVFGFDPDKIYATFYHEDRESQALWERYLPPERIVPMGEKDNFWAMGDSGPCGPCSELLYDRGPAFGSASHPHQDTQGERFMEFWNLVFMEFNRKGTEELERLPLQSVDTGAGLERLVSLKMGVASLFQTDIFQSLISAIEVLSKRSYQPYDANAASFHVIADHLRALAFACADGAQPSNLDRGYVLRKILRRAVRYGKNLGFEGPFLANLLPTLLEAMGNDYPELRATYPTTATLITEEEEAFFRTLKRGGNLLSQIIDRSKTHDRMIKGADAFMLKDTYGLPLEEILLLAKDQELHVDTAGYDRLEQEAKERSRESRKKQEQLFEESLFKEIAAKAGTTRFTGYEELKGHGTILALFKEGKEVESLQGGEEGAIILDETPFYAERGGQMADYGSLFGQESHFEVTDCQMPYPNLVLHSGKVVHGVLKRHERVAAVVDSHRRLLIANNHTATHLLHLALERVLGSHVRQAGSLVEADRLRFDFTHQKALSPSEIAQIEDEVNQEIRANRKVTTYELSLEEVQKEKGIKQFFQEKYGSHVRVVDMESSKELCGGTHAKQSGDIGFFKIIKESALAAGVRRIEAVSGACAIAAIRSQEAFIEKLSELFKAQPHQIFEKGQKLIQENERLEKKLSELKRGSLCSLALSWQKEIESSGPYSYLVKRVDIAAEDLKELCEVLAAEKIASFLITSDEKRCHFIAILPNALIQRGLSANSWLQQVALSIQGKGGGKKEFAQGSSPAVDQIEKALHSARQWIQAELEKLF